jgi:altronate dehydratase large subunit
MTTFQGYLRPDGSVGIRNRLLVLSVGGLTGPACRRIAAGLRDAACVVLPYEAGLIGEDKASHDRAALGLATHPNVGAALLVGDNPAVLAGLAAVLAERGRRFETLSMDACGNDTFTLVERGTRAGAALIHDFSRQRRAPAALSALTVGLECGRSDPSSGLVANPLLGRVADRLVDAGGTAMLGETIEWLGAEHLLAARARTPEVAAAITATVRRREDAAMAVGVDLLGRNPTPTNIASGLTTIEEKSLGSTAKSGTGPIEGVLGYAEAPTRPGLWLMDAPAFAPESLTGFVAAGAQITLFTTGVGNSYVSALAPTLKVSANPESCARLRDQIDFRADAALAGRVDADDLTDQLFEALRGVAGGDLTWGEILGEGDEVVSRFGAAL